MANRPSRGSRKASGLGAISLLKAVLEEDRVAYVAEGDGVCGWMRQRGCRWDWAAHESPDGEFVSLLSYCPMNVPPARRLAVSEFLTRVNWRLMFGGFDMDWEDGLVVCRTSIPCEGRSATQTGVGGMAWLNWLAMSRHLPGLLMVAFGNATPLEALAAADQADQPTATDPPPQKKTRSPRKPKARKRSAPNALPSQQAPSVPPSPPRFGSSASNN